MYSKLILKLELILQPETKDILVYFFPPTRNLIKPFQIDPTIYKYYYISKEKKILYFNK